MGFICEYRTMYEYVKVHEFLSRSSTFENFLFVDEYLGNGSKSRRTENQSKR